MKINSELEILILEISLLHEVLENSLKYRQFDEGYNCAEAFLCEEMSKKFEKIFRLF
jgi:hypothetical protein